MDKNEKDVKSETLSGVSDVLTIVGTSNGANTKVAAAMGWHEL